MGIMIGRQEPSLYLASFIACIFVQELRGRYRLAGCVVDDWKAFLANFISGKIRGLLGCRFRTSSIVVRNVTQGIRTANPGLTEDIPFAFGI